jgi:DtxR family Mn-dependent transcriptional regulator
LTSHGLIDTTEMYLRTVFELEEEGIVPLRARIAERLSQSGPTVSQTVARMERDGLLRVEGDRHLALTRSGRDLAVRVMRKHRLAEVHSEACRWEHVMSESVERRLLVLLDNPTTCPHGNPIPGLEELGGHSGEEEQAGEDEGLTAMTSVATRDGQAAVIRRISEQIQSDHDLMLKLKQVGIQPGREVTLAVGDDGVRVTSEDSGDGPETELPRRIAEHVFVAKL